jgi:hypothetical protein
MRVPSPRESSRRCARLTACVFAVAAGARSQDPLLLPSDTLLHPAWEAQGLSLEGRHEFQRTLLRPGFAWQDSVGGGLLEVLDTARIVFELHYLHRPKSIKQAAAALGISRSHWYELLTEFRGRVYRAHTAILADNLAAAAALPHRITSTTTTT